MIFKTIRQRIEDVCIDEEKVNGLNNLKLDVANATEYATSLKGLGAGILSIASAHPVIASVTAALALCGSVALLNKIKHEKAAKAIKEAYEKSQKAVDEINNTCSTNTSQTKKISKEYAELAQDVDLITNKNKNLSPEKYERFLELSNQLSKLYPSLTKNYDDNGIAILNLSGNVDTIVSSLDALIERQRALANQEIVKQIPDLFAGFSNSIIDYKEQLDDAEKERNKIKKAYEEIEKYGIYSAFDLNGSAKDVNGNPVGLKLGQYINLLKKLGITVKQITLKDNLGQAIGYKLELKDGGELPNLSGIYDTYISQYNKATNDIKYAKQQLQAETSSISQYLNTWLQTEFSYNQIEDDGLQKAIQEILFNFDWSLLPKSIDKNDWESVSEYLRRNILFAINNVQEYKDISTALSKIYTDTELTPNEKENYIKQVQEYFGNDHIISISLQPKLEETETLKKTYDDAIMKFGNSEKNNLVTFFKNNSINDSSEIDYWNKVTKEANTATEAIEIYNKAKSDIHNHDLSLDSYTKASSSISSLTKAFQEISENGYLTTDTVASIKEAVGDSIPNWDEYQHKLLTTTKDSEEFNRIMGELTYSMLENEFGVKGLANADQAYVEAILRENGVVNASAVAHDMLAKAKAKEYLQSKNYSDISADNIQSILDEANTAGYLSNEFINLVAQEIIFNNTGLDVSKKLEALRTLAQQAGITSSVLASILDTPYGKSAEIQRAWAEKHGFEIKVKDKRLKNGQEDWLWIKDGVTYENANEAALAIAGSAFSNALNTNQYVNYQSNNSGGSAPAATETKETFNWIETALSRIQRTITNLGKTVSATWRSWTDRNKALKDQVSAVTQEINLQEQAYNRYMALANGVGLPEPYRSLVENGAIDISTITDENLAEQIKAFQDYYEKALACKDAVSDLNDELANLVQTEFDNTAKRYDDELSMHEHQSKMLQSSADILETKGYMVGSGIYDALARQEEEKITTLQNKYASLESVLNSSNIPKYSEQWYAMQLEIAGVAEEIQNSQKNLAEYNNTLREIDWELFDKLQDKISGVTEESDFLIELMSNKKMFNDDASITEHGQATLGLHAVNYGTYMAKADEYATELEQIRAELANDPYNQTLIDQEKELVEQQWDMILAAEKEKQSMKDLKSEGYDALLDSMSSIIDKRKEMFSQIKDLHDYEKSIADQTAEVSKYQKLIDSMQGMADTEEGRATLQKYEVSLKEAKENLEETEYERYIKDQEQLLDSLYDQTEEWVNSRLDDLDGLIRGVIESTNANASEIQATLETEAESVGATLSTEMEGLWSTNGEFTSVVSSYGSQQLTTLQEILATMKEYFSDMKKDAEEKAKEEIAASSPAATPQPAPAATPQSSPDNTSSGNSSWGSWFISKRDTYPKSKLNTETSVVDRLKYRDIDSSKDARERYYYAMGGSGVYVGSPQQNQWMLTQMKAHGFTDGGRIGPLIKASGEDGFILAKTGEEILSLEKIRALGESFAMMNPVIQSMVKMPAATDMTAFQPEKMVHIDVGDIQMYGVNDPETFAIQLKENMLNNGSIRKIIKDTTFGEALGKNSMIRYTR